MSDLILVFQVLWKIAYGLFDNPFGFFLIMAGALYGALRLFAAIGSKMTSRP